MVKEISERKQSFRGKLERMLKEYQSALIVTVDNVGSSQLQKVRISLRGKAEILLGKNTMTRMIIRNAAEKDKKLNALLGQIKGNCGLVFTNSDLSEIRKIIVENKVPAAAKAGSAAPVDVRVPPGPTGLDPGQTSFFQALHIQTKIVKGAIEIINEVHLIKKGDKVGASEVSLLNKLNIKPFFYGIVVDAVYDHGSVYKADVLDLSEADLMTKFYAGVRKIAALTIRIGYPTAASLPHILTNAWTKLVAVTVGIDYSFKEVQKFKDYLANPEAFAAAHAKSPSKTPKKSPGKGKKAATPKAASPKEESDDDFGGGGLFGDDE